eukprot:PhF_6_TR18933/c0_g1_i1/m.27723
MASTYGHIFWNRPPVVFVPKDTASRYSRTVEGTWYQCTYVVHPHRNRWRVELEERKDDTRVPSAGDLRDLPVVPVDATVIPPFAILDDISYTEKHRVVAVALFGETTWWLGKITDRKPSGANNKYLSGVYLFPQDKRAETRVVNRDTVTTSMRFTESKTSRVQEKFHTEALLCDNVEYSLEGDVVILSSETVKKLDNLFCDVGLEEVSQSEKSDSVVIEKDVPAPKRQKKNEKSSNRGDKLVTPAKPPIETPVKEPDSNEINIYFHPKEAMFVYITGEDGELAKGHRVVSVAMPGSVDPLYIISSEEVSLQCSVLETWQKKTATMRAGTTTKPGPGVFLTIPDVRVRSTPTAKTPTPKDTSKKIDYVVQRLYDNVWTSVMFEDTVPVFNPDSDIPKSDVKIVPVTKTCFWSVPVSKWKCSLCGGVDGTIRCCRQCSLHAHIRPTGDCPGTVFARDSTCVDCVQKTSGSQSNIKPNTDEVRIEWREDPVMECFLIALIARHMKGPDRNTPIEERATPVFMNTCATPPPPPPPLVQSAQKVSAPLSTDTLANLLDGSPALDEWKSPEDLRPIRVSSVQGPKLRLRLNSGQSNDGATPDPDSMDQPRVAPKLRLMKKSE